MAKLTSERVNVDVDMSGADGMLKKLLKKFSAVGLFTAIIITIVSAALFAIGLVPCMITFLIGIVLIIASLLSYRTFNRMD